MKKLLLVCVIVLLTLPAFADDTPVVKFGGQVRMRGYNLENMWDFNSDADGDKWSLFRHKSSLWWNIELPQNVTAYIRITNQNWGEGVDFAEDNKSNKIFVDNAYLEAKKMFDLPVALKIGRQDVQYGTGFVLSDGQSQLGSTAGYLDGVKLSITLNKIINLDGFYFKDMENERSDMAEDDINLIGGYLSTKYTGINPELYVMNRKDDGLKKNIVMFGGRIAEKLPMGLDYSAEFAMQTGDFTEDVEQNAMGYKFDAGYTLKNMTVKPKLFLGYAYFGGDDPETGESERWDVFYGGWPQFGDLFVWKYLNIGANNNIAGYDPGYASGSTVGGEGVYSNFNIMTAGLQGSMNKVFAKASFSKIAINEGINTLINEPNAEIDTDFGNYFQLYAKYSYSKNLSFSVYGAMLQPGKTFEELYGDELDNATEIFWETSLKF